MHLPNVNADLCSGAVGGKTGKILVLPGFSKIERGSGSGGGVAVNDQVGHSDSFKINVESFRVFRDLLFYQQIHNLERTCFESMVHTTDSR